MANDNTETKAPNLVKQAHAAWEAAGKNTPTKKEGAALLKSYLDASQVRKQAEAALEQARADETAAVVAIVRARGKGRLRIAGEVHIPMARGNTAYFRREGGGEVGELG
jgi:hypothetical protein